VVEPVAWSPIPPAPPVVVECGWEVSARRSAADLRLTDCTPLAKVLVRSFGAGGLDVPLGRAARDGRGALVAGTAPGEWLLLAAPGGAGETIERLSGAERIVVDVTHGRALARLTGGRSADLLTKVCGIDLSDEATPDGAVFRSSVAKVVAEVVRDDRGGARSYLLLCGRSYGRYLFDALLDAGAEFGIEVEGFAALPERGAII
jgi:heterotetrameric sarcosine oxidase gamma subunit